jgi:Protein of Unknown function (DUF2784)
VFHLLADAVVLLHLGFILFMMIGGLLVLRWPRTAWLHLPIALWGVLVQWMSWTCPLTPLERWFRAAAGATTYSGGFVQHYVVPVLYPLGIGLPGHLALGLAVLGANALIYGAFLRRRGLRSSALRVESKQTSHFAGARCVVSDGASAPTSPERGR